MRTVRVVLCAVLLVCCDQPKEATNENTKIAEQLFAAFNQHDWKIMANLYADSALFLDPSLGKDYVTQSRQQIITKYADMQKLFPDLNDVVTGIYSSGDKVTVEFIASGTMANGETFKLPIVSILTISRDQIVKDATYYDLEIQ